MPEKHHGFNVDLLEKLESPAFFTLPAGPFKVATLALVYFASKKIGAFRIGAHVFDASEIASTIRVSESEIEAALSTLINRDVFGRDGDGALCLLDYIQYVARSKINKINGLKGGRPKKSSSAGSRTFVSNTKSKTKNEVQKKQKRPRKLIATATAVRKVSSKATTLNEEELRKLAFDAAAIAGLDPVSGKSIAAVSQWLEKGGDADTILSAIGHKAAHLQDKPPPKPVSSMFYYNAVVEQEIERRKFTKVSGSEPC